MAEQRPLKSSVEGSTPSSPANYTPYHAAKAMLRGVTVPPGKKGKVEIKPLIIEDNLAMRLHNLKQPHRRVYPGVYTQLFRDGYLWMSDTHAEREDHIDAIMAAGPRCLIMGLGIGLVAEALLRHPRVELIRIVEIDHDVISLVGPHLKKLGGKKIEIIEDDALLVKAARGERWDVVWMDIWADISGDNLPQIRKLKRYWKRRAKWVGAWSEDIIR